MMPTTESISISSASTASVSYHTIRSYTSIVVCYIYIILGMKKTFRTRAPRPLQVAVAVPPPALRPGSTIALCPEPFWTVLLGEL